MPSPSLHASTKPRPQLQPSAMPLQPLRNAPRQHEPVFAKPYVPIQQFSPQKMLPISPPQPYGNMGYVSIPPPPMDHGYTDSPPKRVPLPPQPYRPEPVSQQPLFTTFSSTFDSSEQENYYPSSSIHDNADFPEPSYLRRNHLKRSYSDVHPGNHQPLKNGARPGIEEASAELPEPEDMPPVEDDGNKPPYSYAQMIGMAILRAHNRRLTLAQIYEWISTSFAFYREDTKQGWHNSIRHNLSLNKAFNKVERPKGDAGKGCYWVIEPGMEAQFLKDKNRKANVSNITVHAGMMRPDIFSASQPMPELAPAFIHEPVLQQRPQTAPALPELSSDATLPASDPALVEEDVVGNAADLQQPQSSPPDAINSSPPLAPTHRRSGSSPTRSGQASSLMRHKRNATTMDDSGYFSSIESSILRPQTKSNVVLTSELDVEPRNKGRGGRAEEEIQRIRSSSHDITPSHRRTRSVNFALDVQSSSPIRSSPLKLNPMTPSVIFKKPMRPPPSVSPNTQLHLHRQAMQDFTNSPIRGFGLWGSATPSRTFDSLTETWSPLKWTAASASLDADEFEIFSDAAVGLTPATPRYASSPLKSARRPGLGRNNTTATAGVLSEMLGNASHRLNAKTPSRLPKTLKPSTGFVFSGSPLKGSMTNVSIVDDEAENDFFDFDNFENENDFSDEGVDLSKGFGKIGAPAPAPAAKRPSLGGRSLTSRF